MSSPPPHAIYEGWVTHCRTQPVAHRFRYRIQFLYLDLDELPQAFAGRWLWSADRPSLAWFRRGDHLGDPRQDLAEEVRRLVAARGIRADGKIRLLTQLRYFGFVMNPVSFYFCDDDANELVAVVAEVHNTPWGETHCYVLPVAGTEAMSSEPLWLDKEFHVSPFMPMDVRYRWQVQPPGETLGIGIENFRDGESFFAASLQLKRRPWSTWELHRGLWLHPFMSQRIYAGIYWQALQLWWKGVPYVPHPGNLRIAESNDTPSTQITTHIEEKLACSKR